MSFGAGHVQDMINRMKQNRSQRSSSRTKFKGNNREITSTSSRETKNHTNFKVVSEKKLNKIKKQIKGRARSDRKKELIFYGILYTLILIGLIKFLIWAS
ncbi:hypothetical protein [Aquimarina intermedia]|uniref:Uncharacterized protein n=1 Tax=Aquimarina intermedia TaxID=350814 RepID=A0A5S5BXH3_9FLAO|nr:hypothetical protein [Aquimarina intermedia]TYP70882.1 hypothetical protein BD809_11150 [Aquimarina intermedia]